MSATTPRRVRASGADWLPVAGGILALYVPVFYGLATGLWKVEEYAHGPIILAVVLWLVWRKRAAFLAPHESAPVAGLTVLIFGLLIYVLGRIQDITILEIAALIPVLAGALLTMRGWQGLRALWFPLVFIVFMVPLPGMFVDMLTGPLKQHVSEIAERILYVMGYPVGRTGVVLTVGQYQLLVADACSGLNSMFSLSALGLFYLYLAHRASWLHNGLIILCILPIAFAANIVRVLVLVLVTYHSGDEAGQGFLHGAAGLVLAMAALTLLLALDGVLARFIQPPAASTL
jgi:exosortase B